ncbi:MAG: helix-turn-helix domain-containing protein [Lachnospiraceae bacterium]|nr:helix-turn-helix domain-containing protein [Lachnospiraceae bacterium]
MLSENIQTLRKINEMTQEQVAEAIGVSRQAVAKYESGEAQPDLIKCAALAKLFDVTLDELVNYDSKEATGVPIAPKGKYMFGMVSVGDKGQIVIPAKARKVFDIKPGDKLIVLGDIEQGLAMVKADFITAFFNKKR